MHGEEASRWQILLDLFTWVSLTSSSCLWDIQVTNIMGSKRCPTVGSGATKGAFRKLSWLGWKEP